MKSATLYSIIVRTIHCYGDMFSEHSKIHWVFKLIIDASV